MFKQFLIWTLAACAAVAAQSPVELLEAGVERLRSKEEKPLITVSPRHCREMAEHLDRLRRGEEGLRDYPWLCKMLQVYNPWSGEDKEATVEMVRGLIAAGADVNAKSKDGCTPLFYVGDLVEAAQALLAAGAEVDARDENGRTPLHEALGHKSEAVYDALVAAGADVNAQDDDGDTPLHAVFCCGSAVTRSKLINGGADVNAKNKSGRTPMDIALDHQDTEAVLEMLHAGAELPKSCPPIFVACFFGQVEEALRLAEEAGLDSPLEPTGSTLLQLAVSMKKRELVEALLAAGADPDATDDEGNSPLHTAARTGAVEYVPLLVEAGADVNARNDAGEPPLYLAALGSRREMVEALLAAGAKVNIRCKAGPILSYVMSYRPLDVEMVRRLLAAGAEVNAVPRSPLYLAVSAGSVEMVDLLLAEGADVNAEGNEAGHPLAKATRSGRVDILRRLIAAGAAVNPSAVGRSQQSPLHDALLAHGVESEVTRVLLEAGAKLHRRNSAFDDEGGKLLIRALVAGDAPFCAKLVELGAAEGCTPLCLAVLRGDAAEVRRLLATGAEVRQEVTSGVWRRFELLSVAVELGHEEIARELLAAGAPVDAKVPNSGVVGMTPLMYAAQFGRPEMCRLLLKAGADPNALSSSGGSPLCYAASSGSEETCRVLLEGGAKVRVESSDARSTPLHQAAMAREHAPELCALLLAAGADPNAKDKVGDTPLHAALGATEDATLSSPTCRVLIDGGADVNAQNANGLTAKELEQLADRPQKRDKQI